MLARKEVHQGEILRKEFGLGEADVSNPVALRCMSDLVDPDALILIGKFDETL